MPSAPVPSDATKVLLESISSPTVCGVDDMAVRIRRITNDLSDMQRQCAEWAAAGRDALFDEAHPEVRPRLDNIVTNRFGSLQGHLTDALASVAKLRMCIRDVQENAVDMQQSVTDALKPAAAVDGSARVAKATTG